MSSTPQGLQLERIVLLGRTLAEYEQFFGFDVAGLHGRRVLDVGAGVSSFCGEGTARGLAITAADPIYGWEAEDIRRRCEPDLEAVVRGIGGLRTYRWDFYHSPEKMGEFRRQAYRAFLKDYAEGRGVRYIQAALPELPFSAGEFDLSLVSYLMFVYEAHLDYDFHKRALCEIMRVTGGEARFYPTVTFEARRCTYLDRLARDPELSHLRFQEVPTKFEFLVGSNSYLSITHRP